MSDYNRQPEGLEDLMPRKCFIITGFVTLLFGLMFYRFSPDTVIAAEKSYNDQRLADAKLNRIAAELRWASKEKTVKYLTAEDADIDSVWPGQGRKK